MGGGVVIAAGTGTSATADSDFGSAETVPHGYSDALSSLPRGRCFGRTPWPVSNTTLELERIVDEYLSAKPLAEQIALSKFMAAVEYDLQAPRSRTTTLDVPALRHAGFSVQVALEWNKRLAG